MNYLRGGYMAFTIKLAQLLVDVDKILCDPEYSAHPHQ